MAMSFEETVKEYIVHTMSAEGMPELLYGSWQGGGILLDGNPNPVRANEVILPKLLTEEQEVTLEEEDGSKRTVKFQNALQDGDRVAVIRSGDGQRFLVVDRI